MFNGSSKYLIPDIECLEELATATPHVIQTLKYFIQNQNGGDGTVHFTKVFKYAFDRFKESGKARSMFLCISSFVKF